MSTEILGEVDFLARSMLLGVMITFLYDIIRILRRVFRHRSFLVSIEDLLFWICCSICIFYLLYQENNGMLRWFVIMGAAIGMMLYKITVSRLFVELTVKAARFALKYVNKVFRFLTKPYRIFRKFLKNQLTRAWKMFRIILCKH